MYEFLNKLVPALTSIVSDQDGLKRSLRADVSSELFGKYVCSYGFDKIHRATLYFGISRLLDAGDNDTPDLAELQALGGEIIQGCYGLFNEVSRISKMAGPNALPFLNLIFDLPGVEMGELVNEILSKVLEPGQNQMLVYLSGSSSLVAVTPSALPAGLSTKHLIDCTDLNSLREQFDAIERAIDMMTKADEVPEQLNSEGFPGPVAGWGGH